MQELSKLEVLQWTAERFIGALYSPSFIPLTSTSRYRYAEVFRSLLLQLSERFHIPIWDPSRSPPIPADRFHLPLSEPRAGLPQFTQECIKKYKAMTPLNETAIYLWRGWQSTNMTGKTTWFRLYPIFVRLGKEFTDRLYEQCDRYFSSRRATRIPALTSLGKFIAQYPGDLKESDFSSPAFMTRFWPEFLIFFITTGDEEGTSISGLCDSWRAEFVLFVKEFLIEGGVVAQGYSALPLPPADRGPDKRTNIRKTDEGIEVHSKLLVNVPLKVTDAEAMNILFHELQDNVDILLLWARAAAKDLWKRRNRRLELAKIGTPIELAVDRKGKILGTLQLKHPDNPARWANACATFERHGYLPNVKEYTGAMYPSPICETAKYLGLPTTSALLPHLTILVATHPAITSAFLEHMELYDKNGNSCCFVETDGGHILRSTKGRKGAEQSWQEIQLTEETTEIVRQIIAITQPVRDYLHKENNDDWRYLLLTSRQGFANPQRITRLATDTSDLSRRAATATGIQQITGRSTVQCEAIVARFSLSSLRATAGVLVYLKTKSVREMSRALGHTNYKPTLLRRYLPDEIVEFFQERWIRIFQTSMIVDSMKDSDYLLQASGFKNIGELNEFLENHTLKKLPQVINTDAGSEDESGSNVLIGLNVETLTALISLQMCVRQAKRTVNETAQYWYEFGNHITKFIESESCQRDDLRTYLQIAREQASPAQIGEIVHE
ncbi:MAG: hypothetical protein GY766_20260 [Herbaspirillum sp.]|nr:hypothetical protein [Herbaspirillum sp.]MCP3657193.1 hypothetical protein [Herbaspirillum sp.]MCP4557377.1 hypothetical protein [Herbaspirillum sp.]